MKTTFVVQIGNSDDRLPQKQWADFIKAVQGAIVDFSEETHFFGCSNGDRPWQNACWVFVWNGNSPTMLKCGLSEVARRFKQDTIALTTGETELVASGLADL